MLSPGPHFVCNTHVNDIVAMLSAHCLMFAEDKDFLQNKECGKCCESSEESCVVEDLCVATKMMRTSKKCFVVTFT